MSRERAKCPEAPLSERVVVSLWPLSLHLLCLTPFSAQWCISWGPCSPTVRGSGGSVMGRGGGHGTPHHTLQTRIQNCIPTRASPRPTETRLPRRFCLEGKLTSGA